MGNPLARRMFSYSCTVWVSLPHVLLGPYSFLNRTQSFFRLSNILLILVVLIIRPRSFLLLVRHTISPSASSTCSSYNLPFPPTSGRLANHLLFHNQLARHLCIFLAILFFQFYCTTVLFIPAPPRPLLSAHRPGNQSTLSVVPIFPVASPSCCLSGIRE